MAKSKKQKDRGDGMVYSTNPQQESPLAAFLDALGVEEDKDPGQPQKQFDLRVWIERKGHAGKPVTLVKGFVGSDAALDTLGKALKTHCGVGGTTKNGEVLLQGEVREKALKYLTDQGHKAKAAGA